MAFLIPFSQVFLRMQKAFGVQGPGMGTPMLDSKIVPTINVQEFLGPLLYLAKTLDVHAGAASIYTVPKDKVFYLKYINREAVAGADAQVICNVAQLDGSVNMIFLGPRQTAAYCEWFDTPIKVSSGTTLSLYVGAAGDTAIDVTIGGYLVDSATTDP